MRSVVVYEHSGFIVVIVSVAGDVIAAFNKQAGLVELIGDAFRQNRAGKTGADN